MMDRIYSAADSVVVWLGEVFEQDQMPESLPWLTPGLQRDSTEAGLAGSSVHVVDKVVQLLTSNSAEGDEDGRIEARETLEVLLSQERFRRRWVIQEVLLQPRRWVLLGGHIVCYSRLQALTRTLKI